MELRASKERYSILQCFYFNVPLSDVSYAIERAYFLRKVELRTRSRDLYRVMFACALKRLKRCWLVQYKQIVFQLEIVSNLCLSQYCKWHGNKEIWYFNQSSPFLLSSELLETSKNVFELSTLEKKNMASFISFTATGKIRFHLYNFVRRFIDT